MAKAKRNNYNSNIMKKIRFKYCGDLEDINASVLLQSLLSFVSLIEEVNTELKTGKNLEIRIASTQKGSFLVELNLFLDTLDKLRSLFTNFDVQTLERITYVLASILILKKVLKGEEPKEVKEENNKVIIITGDNNKVEVDKTVYRIASTSERIDKAIQEIFTPTVEEDLISGVEIEEIEGVEERKLFYVSKSEIPYVMRPNPLLKEEVKRAFFEKEELAVVKVVFAKARKWEFIYNGNKISAYIDDEEFYENLVNRKYSFTVGTRLICDLEVIQVLDKEIGIFVNKEYRIIKVHKVIPPSKLPKLPFVE
jgi:hypothetical protein